MNSILRVTSLVTLTSLLWVVACTSNDDTSSRNCSFGAQNCYCDANGECMEGLECINGVCVDQTAGTDGDADSDTDADADTDTDADADTDTDADADTDTDADADTDTDADADTDTDADADTDTDADADTDTDADADADTDTDTDADGCQYVCVDDCMSINGREMPGRCDNPAQTCCDPGRDGDTDTDTDTDPETDTIAISLRTPITETIYTADASAHVFDGTLYVYPSHDQDTADGEYNMVDYHVFSLGVDGKFIDHGEILHVNDVPWATKYMWAPDAAYKDGTYYFYFPAKDQADIFRIGVATSSKPAEGFVRADDPLLENPIPGSYSIDPAVFVDDDGTAYMYFGGIWGGQMECWRTGEYVQENCNENGSENPVTGPAMGPRVVKLKDNMIEFDGDIKEVVINSQNDVPLDAQNDEDKRFFEGAWMHKYNGAYYLSYSTGTTHLLVYATADNPFGPFTYQGLLLPNHEAGWTTHHSIVKFQGNWYLFYHDNSCSGIDQRRCVKIADLHYNADGSIQTVSLE